MSRLNCLCKFRAAMPTRREANMVVAQVSLDDPRGLYQQRERRSCKAHGEGGGKSIELGRAWSCVRSDATVSQL